MFALTNVRCKDVLEIKKLMIPSQKTTCIFGDSGSGKTTLLKLLNFLTDYEGEIRYQGKDLKMLNPVLLRREVILLPQAPVIFPGTIKHNMQIGLAFAGKPLAIDERLKGLLAKVGLKKELSEDAGTLSGGEKQRLALCRAMLMEPEVLLLDEPTSALDDGMEIKIIGYVTEYIKDARKTLVMVTHARKLAEEYADLIIMLDEGKIKGEQEVLRQ